MKGGSNVLLTADQVAEQLGVCTKTVYRRWREWGLRCKPLGRTLRFPQRDLDNFIEGKTYEC